MITYGDDYDDDYDDDDDYYYYYVYSQHSSTFKRVPNSTFLGLSQKRHHSAVIGEAI